MKMFPHSLALSVFLIFGISNLAQAQNLPVAHWINDTGHNAATVLNTNGVFITDFKTHNDLTVTRLTSDSVTLYTDVFGGSSPGNNPGYLTHFVGVATNGTGDGVAGDMTDLEMSTDAAGTVQFDFLYPLTPNDRILLVDVDGPEQYLLQGYFVDDSTTNGESFTGWVGEDFSGSAGVIPDSRWPLWNPASGTLISGTTQNINEELFVLTPASYINRLVVTKQSGSGWSTDITFLSLKAPLTIQQLGTNVLLNWTNAGFSLQAAPAVTGTFTNIPGATSPYTNPIVGSQQFFRLIGN
jgi:hypothetical protein